MTVLKKNSDLDPLTTPADGDYLTTRDVSDTTNKATGETKRISWTSIKAFFKTYFDTLYDKSPISDTTAIVKGSTDPSKLLRIEVDGFTAETERVLTPQDKNYTLADHADFGTMFPVHYERATRPARSAVDTVTIYDETIVNVNGKIFTVAADTDLELNTNGSWDTGTALNDAARAGHDYYVYACDNAGVLALIVSANSTNPTGYTTATSRKIGGFHCLCVAVGTIAGHTLTNFAQGDILPQSVWDLNFRADNKNMSNAGLVYDDSNPGWEFIYLGSDDGAGGIQSVYNATILDTINWMDYNDRLAKVGMIMENDPEFASLAAGSNEETNITGSADPVTTGGHVDTDSRRMISNIGCEDCAGALNQWLRDTSANYDGAVAAGWLDLPGDKGSFYRPVDTDEIKLLAGGNWSHATYCGSRCRFAANGRVLTATNVGGRGRSRKL